MSCWRNDRAFSRASQCPGGALLVLLLMASAVAGPPSALAANKKAVVFVADSLTWLQIAGTDTPNIDRLAAQGAIAAMSCATAAPALSQRSYLTLGAGSRATHPLGWDEPAVQGTDHGLVLEGIDELHEANRRLTYDVEVGALGRALHQAGLRTALVGNADWTDAAGRHVSSLWAIAIAMDDHGVVDCGEVGRSVLRQGDDGTLIWTDRAELLAQLDRCLDQADVVVIEAGDTGRIAHLPEASTSPTQEPSARHQALAQTDELLGAVLKRARPEWLFVFVTPSPSPTEFSWLTPLIVRGPERRGGLLTSGTTLRPGLVATIDFAPTVLAYFGLPIPPSFTGRPVRVVQSPDDSPPARLVALSLRSHHTHRLRPFYFPLFVVCEMAFVALAVMALRGWPRRWGRSGWRAVAGLQLAILAGPPACFLAHLLAPASWPAAALFALIVALTAALVLLAMCLSGTLLGPVLLTTGLLGAIILVDGLAGARLQLASVFGYSPIVGGRFYGIGNESMSLLLGSSMVGAAAWLHAARGRDPESRRYGPLEVAGLSLFFLVCVVVIGFPTLGANAGGTMAALAGYAAMVFMLLPRRRRLPALLLVTGLIGLFLACFIAADLRQAPDAQTHIGRAFRAVTEGGWPAFWRLATHKLARNLSMLFYTVWTLPVIGLVAFFTWALFRPQPVVRDIYQRYPAMRGAVVGCTVGSAVGFVFNDTGIAIPVIVMSCVFYAIAYIGAMLLARREAAPAGPP